MLNANYTSEENGPWLAITVTAETAGVWVEYYDTGITFDGTGRDFDFTWVGSHPVNHLEIELQRPAGVTLITTSPALGVGTLDNNDGQTYYRQDFGAVAAGDPFDISVNYEKTGDTLTVDTLNNQGSGSGAVASTPSSLKINWSWVIGVAAVALIGYGLYTFIGSNQPAKSKRPRKRQSAAKSQPRASAAGSSVFCHNCGTQALKGDKFCLECGTKLRV